LILKALALGLSSGIFCLGYCYPILGPIMFSSEERRGWSRAAQSLGLFLAGRLIAYLIFGLLSGLLGQRVQRIALIHRYVLPALFLLLGLTMVLYGISPNLPRWTLCRWSQRLLADRRFMLLAGFLAGINICPPFLLALSYALSLGRIGHAVLFFLFFSLSTSVFLLPFLLSPLVARFELMRKAARLVAVAAGLWFVYTALRTLTST
jgi:sulfite exporter TauE/SafE